MGRAAASLTKKACAGPEKRNPCLFHVKQFLILHSEFHFLLTTSPYPLTTSKHKFFFSDFFDELPVVRDGDDRAAEG